MNEAQAYSILADKYKALKNPTEVTGRHLKKAERASFLRKKMYLDAQLWLPLDILNKADKMTMAHSLELRVPYLDLAVLSVAQGCADNLLMRGKIGKRVLRRAAEKVLDSETAYRPKKGFPVPFRSWIREKKYAEILKRAFTGEIGREFFNTDRLLEMLDAHVSGVCNNARVLYTVYAFIVWYEVYFVKEVQRSAVLDMSCTSDGREKLLFDTENVIKASKRTEKTRAEKNFEKIYTDNFGI
jgi:asparagine synthase (glutamine-hydrolysing)